jgi:hypothetical protein
MQVREADLVGGRIICDAMGNEQPVRILAAMDRIYLIIVCASIVLLTIAVGSAWQAGNVENGDRSALFRIVPR